MRRKNSQDCILLRSEHAEPIEIRNIKNHFNNLYNYRTECYNQLVVPRYSLLPYADELYWDLENQFCEVINSYEQHKWIADFTWYGYLKEYTPKSWTEEEFYGCRENGPFIVKGATNSKKFQWNTMMFAKTRDRASEIGHQLMQDSYLCSQEVIIRQYVPLKTYEIGLNGLPFSEEWRFFFYKDRPLSWGYYWSIAERIPSYCPDDCFKFAQKMANIVKKHVNFFVLDVAQTVNGDWILIEINDGSMSGLSECDSDDLYSNLSIYLNEEREDG